MSKSFFVFVLLLSLSSYGQAKIQRSTKKIKPIFTAVLSDSIQETSGLIAFDKLLWTHNDDRDTTLYGLDTLGNIKKKIVLPNVPNQDWEAVSQDDTYLYVGDFGNNSSGNRNNLQILKIEKSSFYTDPKIALIKFSYENQKDFTAERNNFTNFDCEAFIVKDDSIYLFTKQWKNQRATVYVLPNSAGYHIAKIKATLNVKGLITGASLTPNHNRIVLCGYTKQGKPFLYVLSDYNINHLDKATKQRIKLKIPFHQIEGIATFDGLHFYITNENLVRKPIINVPQKLHKVDLSNL